MNFRFTFTAYTNCNMFSCLFVLLLFGASALISEPNCFPIGRRDFLKTDSTLIRSNSGKGPAVTLRGTNLGGWLLMESWMTPMGEGIIDDFQLRDVLSQRFGQSGMEKLIGVYEDSWIRTEDLDSIRALELNLVRVPILYKGLTDDNGVLKSNAFDRLDWLVYECSRRGLYVILDLHGTYGGQNENDHSGKKRPSPELWSNETNQDLTVQLWVKMAKHFKGNPAVAGYDLLNEGTSVSDEQLNSFYNRLYQAIRNVDDEHIIILEAPWDLTHLYHPSVFNWTNVVYQKHHYRMANSESSNRTVQAEGIESLIEEINACQENNNVPVYIGEFNIFDFYDLWSSLLNSLNQENVSWSPWTYKTAPNRGSWAIYNGIGAQLTPPNIFNDTIEEISMKWKKYGDPINFEKNTNLSTVLANYASNKGPKLNDRILQNIQSK